jgi:ribosomal protein L23
MNIEQVSTNITKTWAIELLQNVFSVKSKNVNTIIGLAAIFYLKVAKSPVFKISGHFR